MDICISLLVALCVFGVVLVLPRLVRMVEDCCHFGAVSYFTGPRLGVTEEKIALEDLPSDVKQAFLAALAARDYAIVSMDTAIVTQELPVVVAAPDVCATQWVYSPCSWYNVCARMSSRITSEGIEIFRPLSMRLEMGIYEEGRFHGLCNDPAACCNGLEAINLKAECEIERAFAATFGEAVDLSVRYYRGGGTGWMTRPFGRSLHGETILKGIPVSRWGYIMSLAFRRGIVIAPAVKAAEAAAMAFSSRKDIRKSNTGGEERARLQRQARDFVRSQKEAALC